jgi:hypothetical protein
MLRHVSVINLISFLLFSIATYFVFENMLLKDEIEKLQEFHFKNSKNMTVFKSIENDGIEKITNTNCALTKNELVHSKLSSEMIQFLSMPSTIEFNSINIQKPSAATNFIHDLQQNNSSVIANKSLLDEQNSKRAPQQEAFLNAIKQLHEAALKKSQQIAPINTASPFGSISQ